MPVCLWGRGLALAEETLRLAGWLIPSGNLNCGSGRNSTSLGLGNEGESADVEKEEASEGERWGVEEAWVIRICTEVGGLGGRTVVKYMSELRGF